MSCVRGQSVNRAVLLDCEVGWSQVWTYLDDTSDGNKQLERSKLGEWLVVCQPALQSTIESQAGHDGQCQADIMNDVEPKVAEIGLAARKAVDALGLEDGSENGHESLDGRILENEHPHLAVPLETIDWLFLDLGLRTVVSPSAPGSSPTTALLLLLWHLEGGEEDLAVLVRGRNELTHEEEEVAQGEGLNKVKPWVDVHVSVGEGHLEEAADCEDGQVTTDPQDVELLVGP